MSPSPTTQGCGSAQCACAGRAQVVPASVNGIALHSDQETPDTETLHERACTELLRQRAVALGLLPSKRVLLAPELTEREREVIEAMTEREAPAPAPTPEECRRHYDTHKLHFIVGQALHVRHILFAVTPGVNVHALTQRAESALLELARKDASPGRFAQLAVELSNCPSSTQGGDLGWLGPADCAPELANELFFQSDSRWGMGLHPRLVHTRFGLHIIEVLGRKRGHLPAFEEVALAIGQQLQHRARATALRQYLRVLVGDACLEGIEMKGAVSPLLQ